MQYEVKVTRETTAWQADVVDLPGARTTAPTFDLLRTAVDMLIRRIAGLDQQAVVDIKWTGMERT